MANVQIQKNVPPKQTPARPEPQAEIVPREMLAWDPFRMMRSLLAWDPFREMAAMPMTMPTFSPAFDVKETAEGYAFTADVPGMKQSDIEVSMTGNRLSISGKRETEKEEKGDKYYSCERTFGSFLRSFTLPDDADLSGVSADLRDGVLTIAVKKTPESKPKKVEINQPKS